jgi:hypothetical protein
MESQRKETYIGCKLQRKSSGARKDRTGTQRLSLILQEEISEPTSVSENHIQKHVDLQSSPFASLQSMALLKVTVVWQLNQRYQK